MAYRKAKHTTISFPIGVLVLLVVSAVVVFIVSRAAQQPTQPVDVGAYSGNEELEKEDNDDTKSATVVNDLGQKHRGTVDDSDVDFWKVTLEGGKRYQLQMVKDDNDKEKNTKKSGSGDDKKDEIRFALLDGEGTQVVSPEKKNFSYSVPEDEGGTYYVRVTTDFSKDLRYKFVIKDITNKND